MKKYIILGLLVLVPFVASASLLDDIGNWLNPQPQMLGGTVLLPSGGGTGTSTKPTLNQVPMGNSSGIYVPNSNYVYSFNGSTGTITYSAITTSTGNWLGTWQSKNPSDFLSSSTATGGGGLSSTTPFSVGYVPYATSVNSLANSAIFQLNGNVGIGTTAPSSTLHVYGGASVSGPIATIEGYQNGELTALNLKNWISGDVGRNVVLGFANDARTMGEIHGINEDGTYASAMSFTTRDSSNGLAERVRITSNGKVGIGTAAPSSTLHVSGGFQVGASNLFVSSTSGNVGIGTTGPGAKLEIGSGQIFAPDGSISAPSYSFSNGTNSGIHYSTNRLSFDVAGVEYGFVSGGGIGVRSDSAFMWGTGTYLRADATANTLALRNSTNAQTFRLYNTWTDESNYERLSIAGVASSAYTITSEAAGTGTVRNIAIMAGNVGIGTTGPLSKLDVQGTNIRLLSGGSGDYSFYTLGRTAAEGTLAIAAGANQFATGAVAGDIVLRTEATSQALILNSGTGAATLVVKNGNVGIGTTTPSGILTVASSTTGTGLLTVLPSGNVGIGTTNPGSLLNVYGSAPVIMLSSTNGQTGIRLSDATNTYRNWKIGTEWTTDNQLEFIPSTAAGGSTFTTPAMVINAITGNVGIGNTSPTGILQVGASTLYVSSTSGNVGIGTTNPGVKLDILGDIRWGSSVGGDRAALTWSSGSNVRLVAASGYPLWLGAGGVGTGQFVLSTDGNVGIGTTVPGATLDVNGVILATNAGGERLGLGGGAGISRMQSYAAQPKIRFLGSDDGYASVGVGGLSIGDYAATNPAYGNIIVSGNVGIGTSSPAYTLDVNGQVRVRATTTLGYLANTLVWANSTGQLIATTTPSGGTGLTSLNGLTGNTQTFATGTDTNIQLTIGSTGTTHTFTPIWAGTLADARITSATNWNSKATSTITFTAGTGLTGGGNLTANRTFTNNGVLALTAGVGIGVTSATGTVTVSNNVLNYWTLSGSNLYTTSTSYKVGIATTTPAYALTVGDSSGSNSYGAINPTSTAGISSLFQIKGSHIVATGTVPVVSSCGTSPSIVGTDMAMVVNVGGVAATTCTVTFASQWVNPPACIISSNTAIAAQTVVVTTSSVVFAGTAITSDVVNVICLGNEP